MKKMFCLIAISALVAGCATSNIVQPTFEEYDAAKLNKKTVAITEISESGSQIDGINDMILTELESVMLNHFNVVERKRLEPVLEEQRFQNRADVKNQVEIGKILGADFVVYGTSVVSLLGPTVKTSHSVNDKGEFLGRIWEEVEGSAEVAIKVVDVRNGVIHSVLIGSGRHQEDLNSNTLTNKEDFDRVSAIKSLATGTSSLEYENNKSSEKGGFLYKDSEQDKTKTKIIPKQYDLLKEDYKSVLSQAVSTAVNDAGYKFIKKYGNLDAQVMRKISESEVMINIGSAFGIKPGMQVVVWSQGDQMIDPRTGLSLSSRKQIGILKVREVTSGLSCIAKGSKGLVKQINLGDYVTVNP